MHVKYTDLNLKFQFEDYTVKVLNLIYEKFTGTIPSHSHGADCYELHYIPEGCGRLEIDGVFYELSPGKLYVTGPHIKHAQTPILQNPMQEYCYYFKIQKSHKKTGESPLMTTFLSTPFWYGEDTQGVEMLSKQLFDELQYHRTGYQKKIELLLAELLISMTRNYEHSRTSPAPLPSGNLTDSKSFIIEEYFLYEYRTLSLEELSAKLYLSTRQTQRLLLEYYGKTFQQKKTEARMSAAALFLGDKERSITSISDALGYSSPEHFSTQFKQYYGCSPRAFRATL